MSRLVGRLVLVVAGIAFAVLAPAASATPSGIGSGDPAYSVDLGTLDAALDCDPFTHPATEPVLLVHGTFTGGHEQFDWNYAILLRQTGHDVCIVTYPDRGLNDQQISAEYVSRAIQRIAAESGRKVDMIGHSQGASMPRWSIKWWPSVQQALDDFVLLAGPNHGTTVAAGSLPTGEPGAFFQFAPDSNFVRAMNAGDETPGDVDYTSIYTRFDELVQPVTPVPTAALDFGRANPHVSNILLQDLCPARVVDHLSIGTTDALTQALALDALDHDGPADVDRVGADPALCNLPDQFVVPATLPNLLAQVQPALQGGMPDAPLLQAEPPVRDYAVAGAAAHGE